MAPRLEARLNRLGRGAGLRTDDAQGERILLIPPVIRDPPAIVRDARLKAATAAGTLDQRRRSPRRDISEDDVVGAEPDRSGPTVKRPSALMSNICAQPPSITRLGVTSCLRGAGPAYSRVRAIVATG